VDQGEEIILSLSFVLSTKVGGCRKVLTKTLKYAKLEAGRDESGFFVSTHVKDSLQNSQVRTCLTADSRPKPGEFVNEKINSSVNF